MSKSTNTPLFGTNVDPSVADPQEPFRRAGVADEHGLDLITLQDTFIFWPVAGNEGLQIEAFAKEVVPAVKEAIN